MNALKKYQNQILWWSIILLSVILYSRDIMGLDINKYILVVFIDIVIFLLDIDKLVSFTLFLLPLMCGLPGNYILPIVSVLLLKKNKLDIGCYNRSSAMMFFFVIFLFELVHCLIAESIGISVPIMNLFGFICAFFLLCFLSSIKNRSINWGRSAFCFCIGSCIMLLIIKLNFQNVLGPDFFDEGNVRIGNVASKGVDETKMIFKTNANNIGFYSIATIACAIALFYYKKVKWFILFPILAISYSCGMLSVSRTWAIALAFCVVSYFFFQRKNMRKNIVVLIVLVFSGGYYMVIKNPEIFDFFIYRFSDANIETAGERTELFAKYNEFFFSNPIVFIFGTGSTCYFSISSIGQSMHNGLQQIYVCYGLPMFIVFMIVYIRSLKKLYVKRQYIAFLPMLCVFFFLQTLQFLNPHYEIYPLIAAFSIMQMVKQDDFIN